MYQRYLANVNQLEGQFAALWTQCQRCQVRLRVELSPCRRLRNMPMWVR